MRSINRKLVILLAAALVLSAAACTSNSHDDGDSPDVIMEILSRTQTGANRLRGLLPPGYRISHKTGTIGRIVNDVGVITMPGDLGSFAISVFTLGDEPDTEGGELIIAEMARTAYDFFLFNAPAGGARR